MGQKCDECGKPASTNLQKVWVKWAYDFLKDDYSTHDELLDIEPVGDENLHLCDKCMELWECS